MEPFKLFVCCLFANILTVSAKGGGHGGGHSGGHSGGHGGHGSSHGYSHTAGHATHGQGYHYATARHAYYSYHPPARVYYMCHHCLARQAYPVYHGLPPSYVFTYRESNSRYGDLLTGLSLYNLGRISEKSSGHPHYTYTAQSNERCSLQIIDRRQFEETRIPCFMVSSFMADAKQVKDSDSQTFDISNAHIEVRSFVNSTGSPLVVTSTQECVLWRNISVYQERHAVPCALLKEYSKSVSYSGIPVYIWLPLLLCSVVAIYICCRCFEKKNKSSTREDSPLNEARVVAYRASNNDERPVHNDNE